MPTEVWIVLVQLAPLLVFAGLWRAAGRRAAAQPELAAQPLISTGVRLVPIPDLPLQPFGGSGEKEHSRGALLGVLRHSPDPVRRRDAVLSLRQMAGRHGLELLRVALRDPVDEIRLLAYAALDQREQVIHRQIDQLLRRLLSAEAATRPLLHRRLSEQYWELSNLCGPEVQAYTLSAARRHAEEVLLSSPDDAEVHFLLGRILLQQGEGDAAQGCFLRAKACGMAAVKVLPYLAETAFRQREFAAVKRFVQAVDPVACLAQPVLQNMKGSWR